MQTFLLLHGLPGGGDQWKSVADELGDCRVITPTFAGFEEKYSGDAFPTTSEHAQQIVEWCDGNASEITIVAWSFSCHPLLFAMTELGLRPARAVLIEPSSDIVLRDTELARFRDDAVSAFCPLFSRLATADDLQLAQGSFAATGKPQDWELLNDAQRQPFIRTAGALRRAAASEATPAPLDPEAVASIGVPVDILLGSNSRTMFSLAARRLNELMRCARLHLIPDANHLWPATHPSALARWLLQ